ncbi:tetratricopeptide repeat protein [Actibacterium pelagium]|uniref:Tetratricopeptide repeat-containing protein n=1 Tax=Actibacterium pelagium TaxID=2029103 RepID=A0A917AB30_9RHOB|nr:tetratricopeptide repeat protein [Actibacterium pelagium]GGE40285.1 hypothetical protein GCM10011517_04990 [Actibacterium pelagium]
MLRPLMIAAFCLPTAVYAVGGDDDAPPKPTQTTTECAKGTIWDSEKKECVTIKESALDDDTLYRAVRELAYAGDYDSATLVLDAMRWQQSDRVMTYRGFLARKQGDADTAQMYYSAALELNPDNLLARAYMGMGLVEAGDMAAARAQLAQIHARGGAGGWPERALNAALTGGKTYNY